MGTEADRDVARVSLDPCRVGETHCRNAARVTARIASTRIGAIELHESDVKTHVERLGHVPLSTGADEPGRPVVGTACRSDSAATRAAT